MRLEFDLLRYQDDDLLSLILRNSDKTKEQILREIFAIGLKTAVESLLAQNKLKNDRIFNTMQIHDLLYEKKVVDGYQIKSVH